MPIAQQTETIPHGKPGLDAKVAKIRQLVEGAKRDAAFRGQVMRVLHNTPAHDELGEIGRVWSFVRRHITYRRDPVGVEFFQSPQLLMQAGATGDCDDQVILAAAMLETAGYPVRYRVGALDPGQYRHIWLDAKTRKGWVPLELTKRDALFGFDPSKDFPVTETYLGAPMPTSNMLVPQAGGRPTAIVPTALRTSRARYRYFGLLPSDVRRLRQRYGDAALEGWFSDTVKRVGKQLKRSLPDIAAGAGMIFGGPAGAQFGASIASGFTGESGGVWNKYLQPYAAMMTGPGAGFAPGGFPGGGPVAPPVDFSRLLQQVPQVFTGGGGLPGMFDRGQAIFNQAQALYRTHAPRARRALRTAGPAQYINTARQVMDPRFAWQPQYPTQHNLFPPEQTAPMRRADGYGQGFQLFGMPRGSRGYPGGLGYGELDDNEKALAWLKANEQGFPAWHQVDKSAEWRSYADRLNIDAEARGKLKAALSITLRDGFKRFGWEQRYPQTGGWGWVSRDWGMLDAALGQWFAFLSYFHKGHPEKFGHFDPGFRARLDALYRAVREYWIASWNVAVQETKSRDEARDRKKKQAKRIDELRAKFDKAFDAFWTEGGSMSKLAVLANIAIELDALLGGDQYKNRVKALRDEWEAKDEEERRKKAEEAKRRAEAERKAREEQARRDAAAREQAARNEAARQRDLDRRQRQAELDAQNQRQPIIIGPPAPAAASSNKTLLLAGAAALALVFLMKR